MHARRAGGGRRKHWGRGFPWFSGVSVWAHFRSKNDSRIPPRIPQGYPRDMPRIAPRYRPGYSQDITQDLHGASDDSRLAVILGRFRDSPLPPRIPPGSPQTLVGCVRDWWGLEGSTGLWWGSGRVSWGLVGSVPPSMRRKFTAQGPRVTVHEPRLMEASEAAWRRLLSCRDSGSILGYHQDHPG